MLKIKNRKKSNSIRRKRIVASDSILVTAKLKLLSSISDTLARETLQRNLDLLASNQAQSIIFNRPIVSANSPETTTTQASIMSTTATPQTSVILSTSLSALSNTTALSAQGELFFYKLVFNNNKKTECPNQYKKESWGFRNIFSFLTCSRAVSIKNIFSGK